jgi:2-haloacid dehalogenase
VEDAGIFKPHPTVYQLACDKLALKPADIGFVSANGWDAAGAASYGFAVAWLNRRGEPVDRLPGKPAAQRRSLTELVALFETA